MVDIQAQAAELNVGTTPTVPAVAGGASSSARALNNRLHWLWAWEQAQQRVQARHTQGAEIEGAIRSSAPSVEASAPPVKDQEAAPQNANAADVHAGSAHNREPDTAMRAVQTAVAPALQKAAEPATVSALSLFMPLEPGADEAAVIRTSVDWNRRPVPEFEPQFLHVFQTAEGVRVWLRDFRLQPGNGFRLLAALRRELARSGTALAALTVNGHLVWEYSNAASDAAGQDGSFEGINQRY